MPKLDAYKLDNFKIDGTMGSIRIKSIQKGTIAMPNETATATVTTVDLSKAILIYNGCLSDNSDVNISACYITLTDATTITAKRASSIGSVTVAYTLLEVEGLKSIQSGTIIIGASVASKTATVTAVNVDKAFLIFNGFSVGYNSMKHAPHIVLTNATTITATRGEITPERTEVSYMLVEFE